MVRAPTYDKNGVKKGAWSQEEDDKLRDYIQKYGHWNWRELPKFAGLSRCGKSCRLRWMNYLRPNIKHGNYTKEEEDLMMKLHQQHGNKWSLIATKLPGRTDNEIKNYWHSHLKKQMKKNPASDQVKDHSNKPSRCTSEADQIIEESESQSSSIVQADTPSYCNPILESCPLSPSSTSVSHELVSSPSDAILVSHGLNCAVEDCSLGAWETYESSGDFWTQPFVADNTLTNINGAFVLPYVSYCDDNMELFYQVMQELPINHF